MDIGYEDYFYDYDEMLGDSVITIQERSYIDFIHGIRNDRCINNVDLLNKFVIHIAFRSKYYRTILSDGVRVTISQMVDYFLKKEKGQSQLFEYVLKGGGLDSMIEEVLRERGVPFSREAVLFLKENFDKYRNEIQEDIAQKLVAEAGKVDEYLKEIPEEIKKNHIINICQDDRPEGWLLRLQKMKWEVRSLDDENAYFVYGDCGPIQYQDNKWQPLITASNIVRYIFFPVANNLALCGFGVEYNYAEMDELLVDSRKINMEMAKLSSNFFISHIRHENNNELLKNIGACWEDLFDYGKIFSNFLIEKGFR